MYFWICYAIWMLELYFIWMGYEMMLTSKIKGSKWARAFFVTLIYAVPTYFKLKTTGTDSIVYTVSLYFGDIFTCVYIILMYKEKAYKKFLVFITLISGLLVTDLLFKVLLSFNDGGYGFDFNSVRGLKGFMATGGFNMAIVTFLTIAYRSFINKHRIKNGLVMALFAVNQIAIIWFFFSLDSLEGYTYANIVSTVGIAFGYLADILLFLVVDRQAEQERVYQKVRKLQTEMELESIKYEAMLDRRNKFAKLRHDYNNQLITAQLLLKRGKEEDAYRLAYELRSMIGTSSDT